MADEPLTSQAPAHLQRQGVARRQPLWAWPAAFLAVAFGVVCSLLTSGVTFPAEREHGSTPTAGERPAHLSDNDFVVRLLEREDFTPPDKPLGEWSLDELHACKLWYQRQAFQQARSEVWVTPGNYHLRRAVAFPRDLIMWALDRWAKLNVEHRPSDEDNYRAIAMYEAERERDRQGPTGVKLAGTVFGIPSYLAVVMLGWLLLRPPAPRSADPLATSAKFVRGAMTLMPRQHKIIWVGTACLGLLTLWVPWTAAGNSRYGGAAGYGWIFSPPRKDLVIDTVRLLVPMAVVGLATAAAVFMTRQSSGNQS
jgi:hypothetical protein